MLQFIRRIRAFRDLVSGAHQPTADADAAVPLGRLAPSNAAAELTLTPTELRCGFCAKPKESVQKLIAGPLVFICNECVEVCLDIIKDETTQEATSGRLVGPAPPDLPQGSMAALTERIANLSSADQWLLTMHLLARLRDRQLTAAQDTH